ncbi:hypothetical protein RQP53_09525 [Paucibacter sp. APW11]|uniref:Uncharacterized protein n=1 Tax=Roseateles aquae TaxID=3077235 RepID=A0ABU3PA84_9BURK|nr:hypothetical protein [Paucibacter sp. APW11]MDT8999505.1 hypothetical protein [Paucibacter sp. APW11]
MGFHTQLSLYWDDADYAKGTLSTEQVIDAARVFIAEMDWSEDVLKDLRASCERNWLGEPAFNGVMSYGLIALIESISKQLPDITFYAKGSGEEHWDIWSRTFRAGVEQQSHGPFDADLPPIPEELIAQAKAAHAAATERQAKAIQSNRRGWLSRLWG